MNNRIFTTADMTTGDDRGYTIDFTTVPEDDRQLLRALLETQRDLATYLLDAANRDLNDRLDIRLTQNDYFGDHVDYNPAASELLNELTILLCNLTATVDDPTIETNEVVLAALNISPYAEERIDCEARLILAVIFSNTDMLDAIITLGETWLASLIDYTDEI